MNRRLLIETLLVERERFDALLAQFKTEWMTEPMEPGGMCVKEIIGHITWYEQQCAEMLRARALIGSDLWKLPADDRNSAIQLMCRQYSVAELRDAGQRAFADLLAAVRDLSEEDLQDSSRFKNWPSDWVPWKVIASDSYEHYDQHAPDIRKYLRKLRDEQAEGRL
jgi:hypothetical protein